MHQIKLKIVLLVIISVKLSSTQFNEVTFYRSCLGSSGILCFGMNKDDPRGDCVKERNCDIVVSVFADPKHKDKVRFQLMGKPPKDPSGNFMGSYIAVALSDDVYMGQDSVVECVSNGKSTKIFTSWNLVKTNKRLDDQSYISNKWISQKDNTVYCDFTRNIKSTVERTTFDLNYSPGYYILLAMGNLQFGSSVEDTIGYHDQDNRIASPRRILTRSAIVKHEPPHYSDAQTYHSPMYMIIIFITLSMIIVF